jgi:hypothetical protein
VSAVWSAVGVLALSGGALSEPTTYTLGLSDLTRSIWGANGTEATGDYYQNNCVPNCMQGTFISAPAAMYMWELLASQDGNEHFPC